MMDQTTAIKTPEKPIPEAIIRLSKSIDKLQKNVNELESRLSPVLSAANPAVAGKEESVLCPLHDEINEKRIRIDSTSEQLADIRDRLQL